MFQRAEHLIGGDMVEAERGLPVGGQRAVVAPRGFQQNESADDVGLHEVGRPVDRAVDMAFRREVHHRVRVVRAANT